MYMPPPAGGAPNSAAADCCGVCDECVMDAARASTADAAAACWLASVPGAASPDASCDLTDRTQVSVLATWARVHVMARVG